MATVSIQQAQAALPDLIRGLKPGEEVVITENDRAVARLTTTILSGGRQLGTLRGSVLNVAPDFDAPLADFEDYSR